MTIERKENLLAILAALALVALSAMSFFSPDVF